MANPTELDLEFQDEISSLFADEGLEIACILSKSTPGAAAGDYDKVKMEYVNPAQAETTFPWFTTPVLEANVHREDALLFTRAQENNAELSVGRVAGKVLIPSPVSPVCDKPRTISNWPSPLISTCWATE